MYNSEQMAQRRLESRADRDGYAKSESASSSPAAASSAAVVTFLPVPLRVFGAIPRLARRLLKRDCRSRGQKVSGAGCRRLSGSEADESATTRLSSRVVELFLCLRIAPVPYASVWRVDDQEFNMLTFRVFPSDHSLAPSTRRGRARTRTRAHTDTLRQGLAALARRIAAASIMVCSPILALVGPHTPRTSS